MTDTTDTTRALIYTRVSQDRAGGRSPAEQETESRAWCEREGWTIVDVVTDSAGASRHSKGTRNGWTTAKRVLAAGDVDVLVTWEASRAQRDLKAYAELRELCATHRIRWAYSGRVHDLSNGDDRFRTGMDALMAEREADEISERIQRATRANATAGRPHGRRLFGYRRLHAAGPKGPQCIGQEPDPDEAPTVVRIFREYLAGTAARTIARQLNAEGILRPETGSTRGNGRVRATWHDAQIKRVLTNPAYVGKRVHRGEIVGDADWPALVDVETFDRVAARLDGRRGIQQVKTARLLTGVARCGVCGGRMQVIKDRGGRRVYWCRERYCVTRDERRLDAWVTTIVLDRLRRPDVADALDGSPDPQVSEARARVDELRARLDAAIGSFSAGEITAATLGKIEQDLRAKITDAEKAARAALVPLDLDVPDDVDSWWNGLDRGQQREIIGALVAAVVVKRVGKGRRSYDMADVVDLEWRH